MIAKFCFVLVLPVDNKYLTWRKRLQKLWGHKHTLHIYFSKHSMGKSSMNCNPSPLPSQYDPTFCNVSMKAWRMTYTFIGTAVRVSPFHLCFNRRNSFESNKKNNWQLSHNSAASLGVRGGVTHQRGGEWLNARCIRVALWRQEYMPGPMSVLSGTDWRGRGGGGGRCCCPSSGGLCA
jgi:hypothetical protein